MTRSWRSKPASMAERREQMVRDQLARRGISDPLVLAAMGKVRREQFVPASFAEAAYDDRPLPIGCGQTISQPYIVAYMIEALALTGGEKVLEIGAGSGYAAAVLAEIAAQVFTIERLEELARTAAANLAAAGYQNVVVGHRDGTQGSEEEAPFDAILVSAGAPSPPKALLAQLTIGGRLVAPVGAERSVQELMRITRVSENEYDETSLADVRFVPLIGEEGWEPDDGMDPSGTPTGRSSRRHPRRD